MLPDPPNIILLSSQNIIFQFVDQMLLMMEPFGNGEIDDDVDEIESTMVSLFSFDTVCPLLLEIENLKFIGHSC